MVDFNFHRTRIGQKFFCKDIPDLIQAIQELTLAVKEEREAGELSPEAVQAYLDRHRGPGEEGSNPILRPPSGEARAILEDLGIKTEDGPTGRKFYIDEGMGSIDWYQQPDGSPAIGPPPINEERDNGEGKSHHPAADQNDAEGIRLDADGTGCTAGNDARVGIELGEGSNAAEQHGGKYAPQPDPDRAGPEEAKKVVHKTKPKEYISQPSPMEGTVTEEPRLTLGFTPGVPAAIYHADKDCASRSYLALLAEGKTLAHVRYERENPTPPTPAMVYGQAVHSAILEPELFPSLFIRGLDRPKRSKADKEAWAELQAAHPDAQVLSADQMDQLEAINNAVQYQTSARMLLEMEGNVVEGTGVWQQSLPDGVLLSCKIRPDLYVPGMKAVVDLKTTEDASLESFQRSIAHYGYHYQAGFYVHGMQKLGFDVEHFIVIAVEKKPPHLCAVYRMAPEVIEAGWNDLLIPMQQMAHAYSTGRWDGYSDQIEDVALPPWKMRSLYS